ncbi:MAG: transposase [Planctomycetota bacterium]
MTGKKKGIVTVEVEVSTEVLRLNEDIFKKAVYVQGRGLILHLDARRRNWRKVLDLPSGTKVGISRVRTVNIKELSSFLKPIFYQLTIFDGYWTDKEGIRHDFGLDAYLPGIDLKRGVTTVTLRAAVLLSVLACVGLRSVVWLMEELFHVEISKSSLGRWIEEAAGHLPDAEGMVKRLIADKPVCEAHLDEIFPKGWKKGCVMVIKDEHGRILATQEVEERTKENVKAWLEQLRSWGLNFTSFYIDGCMAYRQAIPEVYPQATIQYDYFHIVQNVFRHLWRAMVALRKEIKKEAAAEIDEKQETWLEGLATRLWNHRYLLFKHEERMSPEEQETLQQLMTDADEVSVLRGFITKVWGIFRESSDKEDARKRLKELAERPEVVKKNAYAKSVNFLKDRFNDMISFLHVDGMKRNSLAESGIRSLRRLERGHDGFRGTKGRDNYLRLYQAIRYCGWSVHRDDGLLTLPPLAAEEAAT